MRETNPYPGFLVRYSTQNNGSYNIVGNFGASGGTKVNKYISLTTTKISLKRENGDFYISLNDGAYERQQTTANTPTFDTPLTIGSSLNGNNQPFRYFKGTISDISLVVH